MVLPGLAFVRRVYSESSREITADAENRVPTSDLYLMGRKTPAWTTLYSLVLALRKIAPSGIWVAALSSLNQRCQMRQKSRLPEMCGV